MKIGNNTFGVKTPAAIANGSCFKTFLLIEISTLKFDGKNAFHSGFWEIVSTIFSIYSFGGIASTVF